jgi:DNA-directed RNA polymerase beta subunit
MNSTLEFRKRNCHLKFVQTPYCTTCEKKDIASVQMPYAGKLLMQELMSMGISPKIVLENIDKK